jgi:hypothetical protein
MEDLGLGQLLKGRGQTSEEDDPISMYTVLAEVKQESEVLK